MTGAGRRAFLQMLAGTAAFARPRSGVAQAALSATTLADRITVITGAGNSVIVFAGDNGSLLVDAGDAAHAAEMLKLAGEVSTLFNTHETAVTEEGWGDGSLSVAASSCRKR